MAKVVVPQKIKPVEQGKPILKCTCCGTEYKRATDFLSAPNSPLYRNNCNRMTVCKYCVSAIYEKYKEEVDDEEAVRRICMKFDIYYSPDIVKISKDLSNHNTRMSAYISKCGLNAFSGKTYDDTLNDEEILPVPANEQVVQINEPHETVTKDMVKNWGFGFNSDEYGFLDSQFDDWQAKCTIEGKAKEMLVRELCVLKLQQNKALLDKNVDIYQKMTDSFQRTLDRASLTPKIEESNDRNAEKPLGVMIEMFEKERPIPSPRDEWKDVDGIRRMFSIYFLGHLCKMLGIKNRHSVMYEEEMDKYRVEIPDLSDADDEDVFDFISNRTNDGECDDADTI